MYLRVLAAEGIFRETVDRHFELTELGSALRSDEPSSPRVASHILPSPRSAIPCAPAYRRSIKCSGSPGSIGWPTIPTRALFQYAMIALSQGANEAVAEAYDFGPFARVVVVRWRPWASPIRNPRTTSPPLWGAIRPTSRGSDGAGWCGEFSVTYRVRGRELLELGSNWRGRLYSEESHSRLGMTNGRSASCAIAGTR